MRTPIAVFVGGCDGTMSCGKRCGAPAVGLVRCEVCGNVGGYCDDALYCEPGVKAGMEMHRLIQHPETVPELVAKMATDATRRAALDRLGVEHPQMFAKLLAAVKALEAA